MHELSIVMALLDQVKEVERDANSTITGITVCLGALSGVDAECLTQAYLIAVEDTPFREARLIIQQEPTRVLCHSCKQESTPDLPSFVCTRCGSSNVEIISGRDLLLKSIDIEDET